MALNSCPLPSDLSESNSLKKRVFSLLYSCFPFRIFIIWLFSWCFNKKFRIWGLSLLRKKRLFREKMWLLSLSWDQRLIILLIGVHFSTQLFERIVLHLAPSGDLYYENFQYTFRVVSFAHSPHVNWSLSLIMKTALLFVLTALCAVVLADGPGCCA